LSTQCGASYAYFGTEKPWAEKGKSSATARRAVAKDDAMIVAENLYYILVQAIKDNVN